MHPIDDGMKNVIEGLVRQKSIRTPTDINLTLNLVQRVAPAPITDSISLLAALQALDDAMSLAGPL